jgi:cyclin-dependent kinase 12/13
MAMGMAAAAAAVALVAVMCVLAPRAKWRGGSSTEETSSQNSSCNQTGARCYTGKTPDADADAEAAAQAASAATPATPPPHRPRREDELLDGWPTWLLNNVPREALQGIVPKSVDAYEKIEKVGEGS